MKKLDKMAGIGRGMITLGLLVGEGTLGISSSLFPESGGVFHKYHI